MIKEEIITKQIFICNECGKEYLEDYISFEYINDLYSRVFEYKKKSTNSHLIHGREQINLCSTKCATNYCNKEMQDFIKEITLTKVRPKKSIN